MNSTPNQQEAEQNIDNFVAQKIRYYRQRAGLTLSHLALLLEDISFQQLQKYESGANRVSSSRLYQIATVLAVPISNFFPRAMPDNGSVLSLSEEKELQNLILEGPFAKEVYSLIYACMQIEDHHKSKRILDLCQSVVDNFLDIEGGK